MRRKPRARVLTSGKLLSEVRSTFMTNGNTFSSDFVPGLPRIIVPVNRDHTDLFLYRRDGNRMTELAYGVVESGNWPDGVDWTVSRMDMTNNKFYITVNPNSDRASVNGNIAGAYRVGAGIEDEGEYIDFDFNPTNAMTTLTQSQFVQGRIGTGPTGTTTYFLDGSSLGLSIPPQTNGKTLPNPNKGTPEKDTVNEFIPPAPEDGKTITYPGPAPTPEDEEVKEEVQETDTNTNPGLGTLILKNYPPCGEITINGEKYEADLWYRHNTSYGIIRDVPRGECQITITFGEITFESTVTLSGRSQRVFVDAFPIVYMIGLEKNWGVNIDDTSVPCIHDILRGLSIITAPASGLQKFTIKMKDGKKKEFEIEIPIGYTVIMLNRYRTIGEEPVDSTEFWTERRRQPRYRRSPPRPQANFLVDPMEEEMYERRRRREVRANRDEEMGIIDPFGEYTMGSSGLEKVQSAVPYAVAAVAAYVIWKTLKK